MTVKARVRSDLVLSLLLLLLLEFLLGHAVLPLQPVQLLVQSSLDVTVDLEKMGHKYTRVRGLSTPLQL